MREEKIKRKRVMSGETGMPDDMGCWYREGELAALAVVAGEVRQCGQCRMPVGEIAECAGVSASTVRSALRYAESVGHVVVEAGFSGGSQRANVVRIVSVKWMKHMRRMDAHGLLAVQHRSVATTA